MARHDADTLLSEDSHVTILGKSHDHPTLLMCWHILGGDSASGRLSSARRSGQCMMWAWHHSQEEGEGTGVGVAPLPKEQAWAWHQSQGRVKEQVCVCVWGGGGGGVVHTASMRTNTHCSFPPHSSLNLCPEKGFHYLQATVPTTMYS